MLLLREGQDRHRARPRPQLAEHPAERRLETCLPNSTQTEAIVEAQREQQYFLDNRGYTASLSDLGLTAPDDVSNFYTISVTLVSGPPPGFTVTATPKTGTRQVSDGALTLSHTGNRTPAAKW